MAYAPHLNQDVQRQLIAGHPDPLPVLLGSFNHKDTGCRFEYAVRKGFPTAFAPDFDTIIYVGPNQEVRLCRVLQTVAYVVVDEDAKGAPVIEKWAIKGHRKFDTSWVGAGL